MSEKRTCEIWEYHMLEELADNLEQADEPLSVTEVRELGRMLRKNLDQFGVTNEWTGDSL